MMLLITNKKRGMNYNDSSPFFIVDYRKALLIDDHRANDKSTHNGNADSDNARK